MFSDSRQDALMKLPSLKGAPLSILLALMIAQKPLLSHELQVFTGYSHDSVGRGLQRLATLGVVMDVGRRRGWMLTGDLRQLPLPLQFIVGGQAVDNSVDNSLSVDNSANLRSKKPISNGLTAGEGENLRSKKPISNGENDDLRSKKPISNGDHDHDHDDIDHDHVRDVIHKHDHNVDALVDKLQALIPPFDHARQWLLRSDVSLRRVVLWLGYWYALDADKRRKIKNPAAFIRAKVMKGLDPPKRGVKPKCTECGKSDYLDRQTGKCLLCHHDGVIKR